MRIPGLLLSTALLPLIVACGASSSTSVTAPTTTRCGVSAQTSQTTIGAAGGTGAISVDTARECQWTATAEVPWLSVMAGGTGQGAGSVTFSAGANASTSTRLGSIIINDKRIDIRQDAAVCEYTVAPAALTAGAAGGDLHLAITTAAFCPWTASSHAPWIVVSAPASGTGPVDITLRVSTNSGPARTGTVEIGGRTIAVSQDVGVQGCTFAIAPGSFAAPAGGQDVSVAVTAAANCAWSVSSEVSWITVSSAAGGTGSGTIGVTVASNSGQARSGTVTIAGQPFTVTQAAASGPAPQCTFSVSPSSVPIVATGGAAPLTITTTPGCAWSVSSVPSWISVSTTGAVGTGTVTLSVSANTGAARTATLTVAGDSVTVTQAAAAAPACSSSLNPTRYDATPAGGAVSVTVKAEPGCAWTTTNIPTWIRVTGGSGTGNGVVTVTVQPNTESARSAALMIAGQTFTVTQAAGAPCSFVVSPASIQTSNSASTQTFTVTTASYCAWTAAVTTGGSWLTIASGTSRTGSGSVEVSVDRNHDPARTGTLTIAGKLVTINQDGK